jgi:hypothetical protein
MWNAFVEWVQVQIVGVGTQQTHSALDQFDRRNLKMLNNTMIGDHMTPIHR